MQKRCGCHDLSGPLLAFKPNVAFLTELALEEVVGPCNNGFGIDCPAI